MSVPVGRAFALERDQMRFILIPSRIDSRPSSSAHLCPSPLCPEVPELQPPPWPQEGFRGEAPFRGAIQSRQPGQNGADW